MTTLTPARLRLGVLGGATAVAVAAGVLPAASPATAQGTATVSGVHGIPGVAVTVCVDGQMLIPSFTYGNTFTGPVEAGTHTVKAVAEGSACTAPAILEATDSLTAGRNYTLVAALKPNATPTLTRFTNNVSKTGAHRTRLTVRHTAQARAVNVWANGKRIIGGRTFTWGDSETFALHPGSYRIKVTKAGSRRAIMKPKTLTLRRGVAYQAYAVGSPGRYRLVTLSTVVGHR